MADGGWCLLFILLLACGQATSAGEAAPATADPKLEERVTAIASELRCLVCQNQTLADSNAPLAVDLRGQIREQMQKGASERDVVDYMVARYGDFVLYRPPFKTTTVLLWAGPLLLMLIGLAVLYRRLIRRRAEPDIGLSEQDRLRAEALLRDPRNGEPR
jgi:cytochrome c-type biogenesis protein CcmH